MEAKNTVIALAIASIINEELEILYQEIAVILKQNWYSNTKIKGTYLRRYVSVARLPARPHAKTQKSVCHQSAPFVALLHSASPKIQPAQPVASRTFKV